ncbi:OmpH family outer membrane protein [Arcicella rigui]|uniref:OmpH family outer membrane protein n=1 Tax=Arcicella rigui TaxID=797020 RepID=A0ABU5QCT4_9BACT|nr:OmpH family outer membrane protein [Arcicella rigui]MEA5140660.1 OmpH family outer membrane protein [Arcicella rigui]
MKKQIFLLILPLFCLCFSLNAQKFGYIDTEYLTSKMPEYQNAQAEIEKLTAKWISEVSAKNEEVSKLEKAYRAEEILLTEEMKAQRLKTIEEKAKEAKELQNKIFGFEGELFKKKQEIMKPVLDEVAKAVEKVARGKKLDFLFDKSSDGLAMLYTNPIHDYTDYVMEELGISTEQLKEKEKQEQEAKTANEESKDNTTKTKSNRKGGASPLKKE